MEICGFSVDQPNLGSPGFTFDFVGKVFLLSVNQLEESAQDARLTILGRARECHLDVAERLLLQKKIYFVKFTHSRTEFPTSFFLKRLQLNF